METRTAALFTRRRLLAGGAGIAAVGTAVGRGMGRSGVEPVVAKGRDRLYAVSGEGGLRLTPLDGETLRDDAAEVAIVLGRGLSSAVVASGDGGMLEYRRGDKVVVERGRGVEREFGLAWDSYPVAMSAGGAAVWGVDGSGGGAGVGQG